MFCENFKKTNNYSHWNSHYYYIIIPNNYFHWRLGFEEFVVFLLVESQMILPSMEMKFQVKRNFWCKNFISSLLNANYAKVCTRTQCISRYIHTSSPPSMRVCRGLALRVCSSVLLQRSPWAPDAEGIVVVISDLQAGRKLHIWHLAKDRK